MGCIDLDSEVKGLEKEVKERLEFLEGRVKYLEDLIASALKEG